MARPRFERRSHGRSTPRPRGIGTVSEGMRKALLRAAVRRETVTYGTLMRRFRLSRGRALSAAITDVDRREHAHGALGFATIVVRKDTGYPGGGYFCDHDLPQRLRRTRSRASDPRLSKSEKDYVSRQQGRIWRYYARSIRRSFTTTCGAVLPRPERL